mgnify:CR=1 FL=1
MVGPNCKLFAQNMLEGNFETNYFEPTQDIISYVSTLETSFSEQEWVWIIKVINALFQIRTWNSYLLVISAKINQKSIS